MRESHVPIHAQITYVCVTRDKRVSVTVKKHLKLLSNNESCVRWRVFKLRKLTKNFNFYH